MFRFKKIASVLTSAVMLTSTIGFAAAASYPQPFVTSGLADAAVVYGANAAISDVTSAIDVQQKLGALATSGSAGTSASVTGGEAVPLFTGGTKLFINNTINAVKTVITKSDMPNTLKEETFSGNVDSKITQTIQIGPNPRITFEKQPTSSQDPEFGIKTSTTNTLPMFNLTATLSKAVNFSHADSEGSSIRLFGMDFTVGSATDTDTIVLLKSATKVNIDSDNPTADVTVGGKTYTIELVSASDTAATVRVTDSAGTSDSKEINEAASKKVGGITIAVVTADETNLKLAATIIAGSDKVTLEDGNSVLIGEDDNVVDGTTVEFGTGNPNNLTSLTIQFDAPESDKDSVNAGTSFTDPVFGTVKLDFAGINLPEAATARELIKLENSGDDKMQITFMDHRAKEVKTTFALNKSATFGLMRDENYRNITVAEGQIINAGDYVVVGNEDDGYLLKLESTANSSTSGTSNDRARFVDVATSTILDTTWNSEGSGTLTVGGLSYTVTMLGNADVASEGRNVTLNYPDSTTQDMIVYPTIQTQRGAKISFYEPLIINLSDWDGSAAKAGNVNQNVTAIRLPDGDGYEDISAITPNPTEMGLWNFTADGAVFQLNTSAAYHGDGPQQNSSRVQIGKLYYNFSTTNHKNEIRIVLQQPGGANIGGTDWNVTLTPSGNPAIVVWEEKDNNNVYNALVVTVDNGVNADDGMGVNDVEDTWTNDSATWESQLQSNNKLYKQVDYWGSIVTTDQSDTDQYDATISYPDEQVYAQVYIAQAAAGITPGQSGSGGTSSQVLIVKDSEVSSVSGKNLFVVGGSCINTVAAKILGSDSPLCAADFTTKTNTGVGQYIIKSVKSPYNDQKIALLVAGYEAADTVNAVKKAIEGVMTDSGTEAVYPIATA